MKKSMFKYFAYSFVAAAALTLASCGSDESYDVTGNPDNLVYFNLGGDNTRSYMVIHTPVSHIGAFEAKFPAKIRRPADAPTTVSVVMDNSLVEQFNAAHGTNYAAVPDGVVSLTNAVAHIQPSEYASADSIQVSVPESSLAQLTEKAYIVPFRISQVQGSGKASQERGVAYIVINTEEKIINDGARSDQMRGTAIPAEEMAAWSCDKDDLAYVMNGDWEGWEDGTYVIDMKAEKKVTGLSFLPLYYNYSPDVVMAVSLSTDGAQWVECGQTNSMSLERNWRYYVLYGAVPARYIKLSYTTDIWGYYHFGMDAVTVYAE